MCMWLHMHEHTQMLNQPRITNKWLHVNLIKIEILLVAKRMCFEESKTTMQSTLVVSLS